MFVTDFVSVSVVVIAVVDVINFVIAYFFIVVADVVIAVRKNFSDAMNQLILFTEDKTKTPSVLRQVL